MARNTDQSHTSPTESATLRGHAEPHDWHTPVHGDEGPPTDRSAFIQAWLEHTVAGAFKIATFTQVFESLLMAEMISLEWDTRTAVEEPLEHVMRPTSHLTVIRNTIKPSNGNDEEVNFVGAWAVGTQLDASQHKLVDITMEEQSSTEICH